MKPRLPSAIRCVVAMESLFLLVLFVCVAPTLSKQKLQHRQHTLGYGDEQRPFAWPVPNHQTGQHTSGDREAADTGSDQSPINHYWQWIEETQNSVDSQLPERAKRWKDVLVNGNDDEVGERDVEHPSNPSSHSNNSTEHHMANQAHGIHVASWRWDEIGIYFTFTAFIIVAGLAKVAFHHAHVISSRIPESCLLILLGTAVGGILYAAGVGLCEGVRGATRIPGCHSDSEEVFTFPTFTPKLFFLILLPPIILESSYSLYDRAFADNIGTVLFYAVVGTIINMFLIGFSLLGLVTIGWIGGVKVPEESSVYWWSGPLYKLQGTDVLVFSALISAVDPVAVLAIFQEVGINKDLYFLVFGESLLNDAVTVVLYTMMVAFASMGGGQVSADQYILGVASFFTVSLGGLAIGIFCGLLTALITRTTSEVRVVEPLALFGMAYLSYLSAELFHFSGIISTIGCGLVQAHYAFANISHKSFTTVKYFIKMLSSTSDAIIFLFLGMVLVNDVHEWHTGFVLWSLFLCLVARFIGVFLLTALANRFRLKPINLQEQFIMAYGGLRGAVSFSLVEMLEPSVIKPRQMFVTTTLAVILFTVFVQGGTIKLFVRLLHIQKDSKKVKHLMDEMNETMFDHVTAGIEEICGHRGTSFFRERIEYLDERYMRPIFTINSDKNSIQRLFEKLTLTEHRTHMYGDHTIAAPAEDTAKQPVPTEGEGESSLPQPPSPSSTIAAEAEVSPLLPLASLPGQVDAKPVTKPQMKFPLIRQQSAPPGSWQLPRPGMSTPASASIAVRTKMESLPEYPEVQLRSKSVGRRSRPHSGESTNSASMDAEATAHAFRKALRNTSNNQYKRMYQKHNRNLIGDDDIIPEIEMALRRRLSSTPAARHPSAPLSLFNSPLSSPGSPDSPKSPKSPIDPSRQTSLEGGTSFPFTGTGSIATAPGTPTSAKSLLHGRQSGQRSGSLPFEYVVENERTTRRPPRPDSLRTVFSPLHVIAEAFSKSPSAMQIQDIEDEEGSESACKPRSGRGASKETGV